VWRILSKLVGPLRSKKAIEGGEPMMGLFSPEAMARAWLQVKANGGGPGVDGKTIRDFEARLEENLEALRQELIRGTYRPQPVMRVLVPKPKGGLRPLAIWTLRDRVAQRVVYDYLEPIFEEGFLDCSYGFRPGRGVEDAVQAVLSHRDDGCRWVVDADIKNCFDSMDSRLLMRFLRRKVRNRIVLRLVKAWLDARIFNPAPGEKGRAGASQGGILSPLLCNIYLHPFDVEMTRRGLRLVRYADDFVILCRHKRGAEKALKAAERTLARLKLNLNPHKTRIVHFDQGFKFLGVFFLRNEHFYLS